MARRRRRVSDAEFAAVWEAVAAGGGSAAEVAERFHMETPGAARSRAARLRKAGHTLVSLRSGPGAVGVVQHPSNEQRNLAAEVAVLRRRADELRDIVELRGERERLLLEIARLEAL